MAGIDKPLPCAQIAILPFKTRLFERQHIIMIDRQNRRLRRGAAIHAIDRYARIKPAQQRQMITADTWVFWVTEKGSAAHEYLHSRHPGKFSLRVAKENLSGTQLRYQQAMLE